MSLMSPPAPPQTPRWYKQRGLYLVLAIVLFLLPLAAIGFVVPQSLARQPLALRSQRVLRLQAFRTATTVLVAQTSTSLLRSVDGGNSFVRVDLGLPHSGLGKLQLVDWAVSPADPSQLYAVAGNPGQERLYYSTDAGATWRIAGRLPAMQAQDGVLRGLAVAPSDFSVLYVIGDRDLWHSVDGGRTWATPRPLPQELVGASRLLVVVDVHDPDVVFASAGNGLWRSTDGGKAWALAGDLPPLTEIASLAQAGDPIGSLLAGGRGLVFASSDGGNHWTGTSVPGAQGLLRVTAVDPIVETTAFVVDADSQVFRSDDAGRHWYVVDAAPGQRIFDLVVNPVDRGHLVMASSDGIWRQAVALLVPTPTATPSATPVPSPTPTTTSTPSATPTSSATPTATPTETPTIAPSPTRTQTSTAIPSATPSWTAAQRATATHAQLPATPVATSTPAPPSGTATEPPHEPPSQDSPPATPEPPNTPVSEATDTPEPTPEPR